jgi:hypothetical protein
MSQKALEEAPVKKRKGPPLPVKIFQIFISLIIFAILGIGLYLSFRSFTGMDPLTLNPQSLSKNILNSEKAYDLINKLLSYSPTDAFKSNTSNQSQNSNNSSSSPTKFKFAIIADSHKDITNLASATQQAKKENAAFIIGMGDFSDVGTIDELSKTKAVFEKSGLPYYLTPGDHDLWDSRNQKLSADYNFRQLFADPYQAFTYQNTRFLLVYDTDNYLGLGQLQLDWLQNSLKTFRDSHPNYLLFVFAGTPLYHPSSDHIMGKVEPKLKNQASQLISLFAQNKVAEIFAADTHFYSQYKEPETNLKMTTVGAVTNDPNPQSSRFVMVDVLENGSYNVRSLEIK